MLSISHVVVMLTDLLSMDSKAQYLFPSNYLCTSVDMSVHLSLLLLVFAINFSEFSSWQLNGVVTILEML